MATVVFDQFTLGAPLNGTTLNDDVQLIEDSLSDLGPFIVSGLVPSAGAGLTVSVTSGVASIGGRVTASGSFNITGLTDATTNHLYMTSAGAGTSNTTGTQPANSVKLGRAVTAGGVVTAVDTSGLGGRQPKPSIYVRTRTLTRVTITPGSDADVTLTNIQAENEWLTLVAGSWASGHNLILPTTAGLDWWLTNNSGFNAVPKTSGGTGPTIATGKTAKVACDGTDVIRMTTDA